jgi:flagellar motility protein MotE (MotC chaperone)
MQADRRNAGGAMVTVLMLVVGLLIGLAAGIVPRFFGVDPMTFINHTPEAEARAAAEKPAPVLPEALNAKELELRRMIADVTKQRAALEAREKPLIAREVELAQQSKALETMKADINHAEEEMKKFVMLIETDEQKNVKKMAKIWASMDPAEVVPLIRNLDIEVAAKVLGTMSERQAAPILGTLATTVETNKIASDVVMRMKKLRQEAPAAPAQEAR